MASEVIEVKDHSDLIGKTLRSGSVVTGHVPWSDTYLYVTLKDGTPSVIRADFARNSVVEVNDGEDEGAQAA